MFHDLLEAMKIFGIDAPRLLWYAAFGLPLFALSIGIHLYIDIWKFRYKGSVLSARLQNYGKPIIGNGLSISQLEGIIKMFAEFPCYNTIWKRIESKIIRRSKDVDEYWLSAQPFEMITPAAVYDEHINREFYEAFPGILTGVGLLFTFGAILLALLHVHVSDNLVKGLPELIEGLSGKFITSIAALIAATMFTFLVKRQFHRLDKTVQNLINSIGSAIPVLTPMHLLVELQSDIGEQSIAFRMFNADLSGRLKQSFSESMGPTLQRMVEAVDDLNKLLSSAEEKKNDTISENLSGMISRLETSLTNSLNNMGAQFTSSLSGSTMTQFSRLTESLAGAASVLEQMNQQNRVTQSALTELVSFAKNSAAEQMALGRSQIEDLTNVLRSMLVQIEQTTGSSVNTMGAAITALMSDLSSKVTELTEQSRMSMAQSSQASADAATTVLKNATDWSIASKEQLAALIEKHTNQLNTADKLRSALESAATRFTTASGQFDSLLPKLQQVAADAGVCTTAMSGAARSVKDSQDSLQRVAGIASTQVERLSISTREQQEFFARIPQTMQQYENTFTKVETSASSLFQTLEKSLAQHFQLCQRGYESLIKVSDEHFAEATKRLGASVTELQENLQDLSEILESAVTRLGGRESGKSAYGK